MILYLDTETFSPLNLFTAGLAKYATQVEVTILTWAIDDGPVHVWDVTRNPDLPKPLASAAEHCSMVKTHNSQFDSTVVNSAIPELGKLLEGKWYCTMAQALRHGLPGGLDKLSFIFKLGEEDGKIKGRSLVLLFCKLDKHGQRATRLTHPAEWAQFLEYAKRDVVAMRAFTKKCPKWNDTPTELALWALDQNINNRGIAVDVEFAKAAIRATTAELKRLGARTSELTGGTVERATQRDRLLAFLCAEYGVNLPDLKADTIERRLEDPELPEYVKELLRLRQSSSKSSTSKFKRLVEMHLAGRIYFLLQYCAAYRTGRWGGRNFQPQNLPRPTISFDEILTAINAVVAEAETLVLDDIMGSLSSAIRSALCAGPGRKLVVSDLANIEGRTLAWVAGEEWKLQAFRDYDDGIGPDLYKLAYARSFGVTAASVTKDQRQIGKVQELALGYEGGVGAFVAMAATYGVDLEELAERARPTIPAETLLDAEDMWQWAKRKKRTLGLERHVYVVCRALVVLWREAHPRITALWPAVEEAARSAILSPGKEFVAGRLTFDMKGAWLRMRLPSGRYLLYPNAKLVGAERQIQFATWNVYKKAWTREPTYGGKLVENACQAIARDVMASAMPEAERQGFPIVLTVHDELVTEPLDSPFQSAEVLSAILATNPKWAESLPLAAAGFETMRYRKDD